MPVITVTSYSISCDCCGAIIADAYNHADAAWKAFLTGADCLGVGTRRDVWWCKPCADAKFMPPLQDLAEALVLAPAGVVRIVSEDDGEE